MIPIIKKVKNDIFNRDRIESIERVNLKFFFLGNRSQYKTSSTLHVVNVFFSLVLSPITLSLSLKIVSGINSLTCFCRCNIFQKGSTSLLMKAFAYDDETFWRKHFFFNIYFPSGKLIQKILHLLMQKISKNMLFSFFYPSV